MFNNIVATLEFCVYHLLVVTASRVSKIQAIGWAKRQDELLRRYLAAMTEIRMLRGELTRVKGRLALISGGKQNIGRSASFYLETPKVLAQISCQSPGSQKLITDNQQPTTEVVYLSEQDRYRALLKAKAQGNGLGEADLAFMAEYETSTEYHFSKELYQTEYAFYQVQAKGA